MKTFTIAHLNIQNVNVVIVFLDQTFDHKTTQQQQEIQALLQGVASQAKLAGNVVPVWTDSSGRTKFIAPRQQHPYFQSTSYEQLYRQSNKRLHCA